MVSFNIRDTPCCVHHSECPFLEIIMFFEYISSWSFNDKRSPSLIGQHESMTDFLDIGALRVDDTSLSCHGFAHRHPRPCSHHSALKPPTIHSYATDRPVCPATEDTGDAVKSPASTEGLQTLKSFPFQPAERTYLATFGCSILAGNVIVTCK